MSMTYCLVKKDMMSIKRLHAKMSMTYCLDKKDEVKTKTWCKYISDILPWQKGHEINKRHHANISMTCHLDKDDMWSIQRRHVANIHAAYKWLLWHAAWITKTWQYEDILSIQRGLASITSFTEYRMPHVVTSIQRLHVDNIHTRTKKNLHRRIVVMTTTTCCLSLYAHNYTLYH